ncbi:MAG: TonB-dependent receptor [Deltaproteobacteria bacterium]|jgi:vitamin B12 transporter|nr:TonB-dependent receptor [Deltaproteobacteria bacterium]
MSYRILSAIALLAALAAPPASALAQDGSEVSGAAADRLSTVVVSASRTAEQLREVSSNITVLTAEDIERAPADNLGKLLQQQGFWSVDYGATQFVEIRGMYSTGNTQPQALVLILVNGRRTGIQEVNRVPIANVERVEIIRGPAAVQYGTSAMGGVINVITKRGQGDFLTGTVEAGFGSFGLAKEVFTISGGVGNFDFSGSFSHVQRGDIKVSLGGGVKIPHTMLNQHNVMADVGYTFLGRHRIGVNYSFDRAVSEWPAGDFRDYLPDILAGSNLDNNYGQYTTDVKTAGVTYDGSTEGGSFDWSLFYSATTYRRPSTGNDPTYGHSTNYTNQDLRNWGASLGFNSRYFDVDLGVDHIQYKIRGLYDGRSVSEDLGVYLSSKLKLLDDSLFISLGGRYDTFSFENQEDDAGQFPARSKSNFSPSVGVAFLPLDWLKLRANYSEGFRMPTAFEYAGGLSGGWPYYPNPNLQPEESKTTEFGFDVDYRFLSASFTYFFTDWQNKILSQTRPAPLDGSWYVNIKRAKISGIELALSADLGDAFSWGFSLKPYLNFTRYTKAVSLDETQRLVDGSDRLPVIPAWTLAYGVTVDHRGIDLSANINAVQMGTVYHNIRWGTPPRVVAHKPGLVSVDLSVEKGLFALGKDGDKGTIKLRFEARNIFDNDNEVYYNYPGPGRNFYVGLKYVY